MKIIVPVKRVVDYNVKVRVKSDQSDVDIANVKMSMNPFDEIAVEQPDLHLHRLGANGRINHSINELEVFLRIPDDQAARTRKEICARSFRKLHPGRFKKNPCGRPPRDAGLDICTWRQRRPKRRTRVGSS